jgi:trans-aconitate methyltransferase
MAEWKLDGHDRTGAGRPWMNLAAQPGFGQRAQMVGDLVRVVARGHNDPPQTVTDLGCGDGALLATLPPWLRCWGYEIGAGDVAHARARGLDVRQADILTGDLDYGDLLIASEVLEHLDDPAGFLRGLPGGRWLIVSSPSLETGDWHNDIHSWAWDMDGYAALLTRAGWEVVAHNDCPGGHNTFAGVTRRQRFQAVLARRP